MGWTPLTEGKERWTAGLGERLNRNKSRKKQRGMGENTGTAGAEAETGLEGQERPSATTFS